MSIPRFRWTHNNGPFMFVWGGGEVDAKLFPSPNQNTWPSSVLVCSPPPYEYRGQKGLTNSPYCILPGTLLPIFYESLCDFVSMTNCLLLSSCRNLCHNAVNLWLAIPILVVASTSMKRFFFFFFFFFFGAMAQFRKFHFHAI